MTYHVLFNPKANNNRGEEESKKLSALLSSDECIYYDITKLSGYDLFFSQIPSDEPVILCGGDGTLNRFINKTIGLTYQNDLYYYATGSGNDFLTDIGGKKGDMPVPLAPYLKSLPFIQVNGITKKFLNGIGYGIDGYCCEVGDQLRETSSKPVNYTSIAIKGMLFHFRPRNATITVDGVSHTYQNVWLAPTMNGRFFGGGMMPTPNQNRLSEDRTLSVMVFHHKSILKTLITFPSIFSGKHVLKKKIVEILTGHEIEISFDKPTPLQIDGETVLGVTKYEAYSEPAFLKKVAQNNSPESTIAHETA